MEASAARRPSRQGPRVPAALLRLASEDRLVAHVRDGSEAAFEVVFDRHHRGILAFCRHMLGSADEAEDAVQHTFMAAYRSLVGSTKPIQLRPWLYTIARNRCLSVLRARRERPVEDLGELPTENLSTEVQRRQDLRDLLGDVGQLPDDQRAALVLAEVGGASHDEIAQLLGVQREKVKALVFQARSSLIASRQARDTPCAEIREQLSELSGGALRRNNLRRHLKACTGCREFRAALQDQRRMLAVALPVIPTLALKQSVMTGALGSSAAAAAGAAATGGAAGAGAGGSLIAGGGTAMTAKVLAVAAIAGGGAAGVKAVEHELATPATRTAPAGAIQGSEQGPARTHAGTRGGKTEPHALRSGAQPTDPGVAGERKRATPADERSKGREGERRRSDRADERASGPDPSGQPVATGAPAEPDPVSGANRQNETNGGGANAQKPDEKADVVKGPKKERVNAPALPDTAVTPAKPTKPQRTVEEPVPTPAPATEAPVPTATAAPQPLDDQAPSQGSNPGATSRGQNRS